MFYTWDLSTQNELKNMSKLQMFGYSKLRNFKIFTIVLLLLLLLFTAIDFSLGGSSSYTCNK